MKYVVIFQFLVLSLIATSCFGGLDTVENDSTRIQILENELMKIAEDHCEVPCGIYGDSLRIALIDEHIRTIEKAMNSLIKLEEGEPNYNQIVRWVTNKEKHAEEIQHIVSQYFVHQRIKIVDSADEKTFAKYQKLLMHLHHISVYSMKCKQGIDLENVAKLKAAVESFEDTYFHKH